MLTPEQISAIRDRAGEITDPIIEYLLRDIARRISDAGQLTASASYQIELAQQLGLARKEIEKELKRLLKVSESELKTLLTQSAEVGYRFDLDRFGVEAVPFDENVALQQIVEASVALATKDFKNITQTLGMVGPYGRAMPLQDAYRKSMDFALKKVATGATDLNTAVRDATKNIAKYGVRTIDYQSGVHRSLEAAVRGCVMGGLGLMQEQISQRNHDDMGANGWEIHPKIASAPDHEPFQGKQYSDKEFEELNNSLIRRFGTLNCGHAYFPIILGVNKPLYSEEELAEMRRKNHEGVTYDGKHYTLYEAGQTQRKLERSMRTTKRKILLDEELKDDERLLYDQIRLRRLGEEYTRFSKAAGLPTQRERAQVVDFNGKKAGATTKAANRYYKEWSKSVGVNSSLKTLDKYYDLKYNNPPAYRLLKIYARDVEDGWISPNASFENYLNIHDQIQERLVGKVTSNGILIKDQSEHFLQRVLGTMVDPQKGFPRSGVSIGDIEDALFNPIKTGEVIKRSDGKRSVKLTGKRCDVSINPDSGMLIQTNPRKEE